MKCSQLTQLQALSLEAGIYCAGSVRSHATWKGSTDLAWMPSTVTEWRRASCWFFPCTAVMVVGSLSHMRCMSDAAFGCPVMQLRCWSEVHCVLQEHWLPMPDSAAWMSAPCGADVLAAKPQSAALLLDWCSSRSRLAAPQVLLHLWRREERRQGLCTESGVLADVDWPLQPRKAEEGWTPDLSAMYGLRDESAR